MTYRKSSNQFLAIFSTLIVFGILYAMFYLSHNQELKFSTSSNYDKLSFEFQCSPSSNVNVNSIIVDEKQQQQEQPPTTTMNDLYCEPSGTSVDPASNGLTPSDLLYHEMMINTPETNNNNN